jgi:hypothetical protein
MKVELEMIIGDAAQPIGGRTRGVTLHRVVEMPHPPWEGLRLDLGPRNTPMIQGVIFHPARGVYVARWLEQPWQTTIEESVAQQVADYGWHRGSDEAWGFAADGKEGDGS